MNAANNRDTEKPRELLYNLHSEKTREVLECIHLLDSTTRDSPESALVGRSTRGYVYVSLFSAFESFFRVATKILIQEFNSQNIRFADAANSFQLLALARFHNEKLISPLKDHEENLLKTSTREEARLKAEEFRAKNWLQRYQRLLTFVSTDDPLSLETSIFPDNGSYFAYSQIELWFTIFNIPLPPSLPQFQYHYTAIRKRRNEISHGEMTAEEVGRNSSTSEVRELAEKVEKLLDTLCDVLIEASSRPDFFRRFETTSANPPIE